MMFNPEQSFAAPPDGSEDRESKEKELEEVMLDLAEKYGFNAVSHAFAQLEHRRATPPRPDDEDDTH